MCPRSECVLHAEGQSVPERSAQSFVMWPNIIEKHLLLLLVVGYGKT